MSMQTLTILQFIGVLAAYLGMTVLLPAFVFYRKVSEERFCVRFLIYLVIGNVYIMNLVLVLQLLHISYWITLFLGTVIPVIWTIARVHNTTVKDGVLTAVRGVNSFLGGTMGSKLLLSKIFRFLWNLVKMGAMRLFSSITKNFFDWVATVGSIVLILWLYGSNMIWNFGYGVSDMPVHNYWINALSKNNIFVAGVYPHGFHCMIYYLHEMFGFYTYVLMRVFYLVQVLMVHMVLLAFLKACCRTKYSPYIAMVMYIFANIWNKDTYTRFYGTLPQEFGMIFILPSIFFLYAFFEDRKKESGKKGWKVHSTRYLIFFGLSFSATLAAHFYNTMIAGLFCIGVGIGFLGLIFRKAYFGRIMLAGILSIMLAVLPMAIAVATGTRLEGSLRWGMSIISSSSETTSQTQQSTTAGNTQTTGNDQQSATGISGQSTAGNDQQSSAGTSGSSTVEITDQTGDGMQTINDGAVLSPESMVHPEPEIPLQVRIKTWIIEKWEKIKKFAKGLQNTVSSRVLNRVSSETVAVALFATVFMGVMGMVYLIMRSTRHYGCILLSMVFCLFLLYMVMMSAWLGIPALMDQSRCSIYLAYLLSAAIALAVDAGISLLVGWIATKTLANMFSFGLICMMTGLLTLGGMNKEPLNITALECNDAITCLTNILRDNPHFQFTVCSANDELRMVEDYGFHYETITLLRGMEGERVDEYLTIPTPRIYFFIEKIPIDYTMSYEGSGRAVSKEGASAPLPRGTGISMYKGPDRYVVMSKMYYWAQAFQSMYPNEMRVYYETDAFVCYVLEQNTYRLFDLSIDYGYNRMNE